MKSSIKNLLSSLPFVKTIFQGQAIILMLHRIAPPNKQGLPENENMKVDPKFLESFIIEAKQEGYQFLSLDEMLTHLNNNSFKNHKNIIITIDDGYKDNFTYGFDIFCRHQVPFCIYLCTGFLDKPNMWWFSLEDFLLSNTQIDTPIFSGAINSMPQKSQAFLIFRDYVLTHLSDNIENLMNELGVPHKIDAYRDLALSKDEIHTMLKSPLFTLGNHTHTHPVLNNLSHQALKDDIFKANTIIEGLFGITPKHFALPFGGRKEIDEITCDFVRTLGFESVVTTRTGTIYNKHKDFTYVLPRIFLSNGIHLKDLVKIRKSIFITY